MPAHAGGGRYHPGWSLWAAIVILCREILVSGLREYLAELRVSVPVTQLAKWKTTLQLVAVGFLIAGKAGDAILPIVTPMGSPSFGCPRYLRFTRAGIISVPGCII